LKIENKIVFSILKIENYFQKTIIGYKSILKRLFPISIRKELKRGRRERRTTNIIVTAYAQVNCTNAVLLQTLQCVVRNTEKSQNSRPTNVIRPRVTEVVYSGENGSEVGGRRKGRSEVVSFVVWRCKDVQRHRVYQVKIEGISKSPCLQVEVLSQK